MVPQDSATSQLETHVVFCCGHDALGGAGAKPFGVLTKLEAFSHVDSQQVTILISTTSSILCFVLFCSGSMVL
jgi:hypothetical protein